MSWLNLEQLLVNAEPERPVSVLPALSHAELCVGALRVAGALRARGVHCVALHLADSAELAMALLGAWRAGVSVLLAGDDLPATRQQLASQCDLWLDSLAGLDGTPLAAAVLDLDQCHLFLCTSGSSGAAKLVEKTLRQLATEVSALERLWGADLAAATVLSSVSAQHIYGLLFAVLWPLCAGRVFLRRPQPFPEDLQRASLAVCRDASVASADEARRKQARTRSLRAVNEQAEPVFNAASSSAVACGFVWVASPALLKRMGENLDWPALSRVRRVFSSGGPLPSEAAQVLQARLGQWPTEVYGSSETGGIAWRQGGDWWQPFAGIELGQSAEGALNLSSPYLPAGVREQTADAVEMSADGRFRLRGRLDRIVKLEEKRISLPQLEQTLLAHDWVGDARLGVIHGQRAVLGALLALSPRGVHALRNQGRRCVTEALRTHLAAHCVAIALPRRWRLFSQLPYTPQGKLAQATVEALLSASRPTQIEPLSAVAVAGEWQLELEIPLDLAHFSGHFATTPVLPGVVQVDWALQLARQLMPELPARFVGMEVLKFQQLARPGDRLQLSLRFDSERGKLYFAYRNAAAACSSGRILLGNADV